MKRIALLSDSHGHLPASLNEHIEECNEIWHAGDIGTEEVADTLASWKPLRAVYGNIDGQSLRARFPEDLWFECEGLRVFMTHIGGYPPRYTKRTLPLLQAQRPGLFVAGHSHILKIMPDKNMPGILHINPGAVGKAGFHKVSTMVRFSITAGKIHDMQVIELGKRA